MEGLYEVIAPVSVPAFGMTVSTLVHDDSGSCAQRASVWDSQGAVSSPDAVGPTAGQPLTVETATLKATFSETGLLQSMTSVKSGATNQVLESPVEYKGDPLHNGKHSGAYLFRPAGEPTPHAGQPRVIAVRGAFVSEIHTQFSDTVARVARISDYGLQSTGSSQAIELDFVSDLGSAYWDDKELYVQFSTGVKSQGRFWTDLNDFHMDKHESPRVHEHSCTFFDRPNQDCNPIASLFYPITTTAFIQGEQKVGEVQRFSLHSDRPCGAASRRDGMIEVGLDRRLSSDDEKGLAQGVTDNVLTKLAYVLTFETGSSPVQKEDHTSLLSALVVESMSRPFTIMHGTVGKSIATREVSTWQNDGAVDWPCELDL